MRVHQSVIGPSGWLKMRKPYGGKLKDVRVADPCQLEVVLEGRRLQHRSPYLQHFSSGRYSVNVAKIHL
jgi:hypothetical protein